MARLRRSTTDHEEEGPIFLKLAEEVDGFIRNSPFGILFFELKDNKLVFIKGNRAAELMLASRKRIIGLPIEEAFPVFADTKIPEILSDIAIHGKAIKTQEITLSENNRKRILQTSAFQIAHGKVVSLFFDITDLRQSAAGIDTQLKLLTDALNERNNELAVLNNKKVLIVEDDEMNFAFLEEILSSFGMDITHAVNGFEAVDMTMNELPDLIIMDIRLPLMNGLDATRKIREKGIKIPIIAQTAYAMSEDKEVCLSAGCNDYVSKPIHKELFLKKVTYHLHKKNLFLSNK